MIAATRRVAAPLAEAAATAGWRVRPPGHRRRRDPPGRRGARGPARYGRPRGRLDPPGADERSLAAGARRPGRGGGRPAPDLVTVLSGGLATPGGRAEGVLPPERLACDASSAPRPRAGGWCRRSRRLLDGLRGGRDDGRRAARDRDRHPGRGPAARRRGRRGAPQSGAARAVASRVAAPAAPTSAGRACRAPPCCRAAFTRRRTSTRSWAGWRPRPTGCASATASASSRSPPWGDAAGEGALLRMAAARAALSAAPRPRQPTSTCRPPGRDGGGGRRLGGGARRRRWRSPWRTSCAGPGAPGPGRDHARLLAPLGDHRVSRRAAARS